MQKYMKKTDFFRNMIFFSDVSKKLLHLSLVNIIN